MSTADAGEVRRPAPQVTLIPDYLVLRQRRIIQGISMTGLKG